MSTIDFCALWLQVIQACMPAFCCSGVAFIICSNPDFEARYSTRNFFMREVYPAPILGAMAELLFDHFVRSRHCAAGWAWCTCVRISRRRVVALKTFPPELLADGDVRERFIAEAAVWVRIGRTRTWCTRTWSGASAIRSS